MVNTKDRLELENIVRNQYNLKFQRNARIQTLAVGSSGSTHEFDLFEKKHIIGGITTSPVLPGLIFDLVNEPNSQRFFRDDFEEEEKFDSIILHTPSINFQ